MRREVCRPPLAFANGEAQEQQPGVGADQEAEEAGFRAERAAGQEKRAVRVTGEQCVRIVLPRA